MPFVPFCLAYEAGRNEAKRPAEAMKAAEEKTPAEEKVIVSEDPPDAKYTITGKRVY